MSKEEQPTFTFEGFEPANTTPVPDVLFDELLPYLSEGELKIMLYIIRRTLGFKKTEDGISLNQFQHGITTKEGKVLDKGCGIKDRKTITKALKSLETQKNCIETVKSKTASGDHAVTLYRIKFRVVGNSNHPMAIGSGKFQPPLVGKTNHGGGQNQPRVVGNSNPQETVLQSNSLQETEVQEETNTVHVSTDTHASLSRPLVFHPQHDFIALDDAIAPKEMTVFMTPEKYFSEYEDKRRERIASEVHYELQQRGHSVTFKWEQEPESNYKFAPEVVDATNSPSSLQSTEEKAPAQSDEQSSKQESTVSHSQSAPHTTAQDSAKQAPSEQEKPKTTRKRSSKKPALDLDAVVPVPPPDAPASDMAWSARKAMLWADHFRGFAYPESGQPKSKYARVKDAVILIVQRGITEEQYVYMFRFMKGLLPNGLKSDYWSEHEVDAWTVNDHWEDQVKEIKRKSGSLKQATQAVAAFAEAGVKPGMRMENGKLVIDSNKTVSGLSYFNIPQRGA